MLDKKDLEKHRRKLDILIIKKAPYEKILKASQELDKYITLYLKNSNN